MKRLIVCIVLCISVAATAQIKVACIGNSITYGAGVANPQSDSYPAQLATMLGTEWKVGNFGLPGATLLKKGDLPYYKQTVYANEKAFQPDVVIIKLGTNDSKAQNWKFKDDFVADYTEMINELKSLPSHPFIIVCIPVPTYSLGYGIRGGIIRYEITPMIKTIAKNNKLKLINLYKPLRKHPQWFPDGIHPNEAGAAKMAAVIYKKLLKYKKKIQRRK